MKAKTPAFICRSFVLSKPQKMGFGDEVPDEKPLPLGRGWGGGSFGVLLQKSIYIYLPEQ